MTTLLLILAEKVRNKLFHKFLFEPHALIAFYLTRCRIGLFVLAFLAISPAQAEPEYAPEATCANCHASEVEAWKTSHHFHAMEPASVESVLGDFNSATFVHQQTETQFFRRDDKFYVRTKGADGVVAEFQVTHTFGYAPLQQYLIAFPDGRRQAFDIAWDIQGKKWFHLIPDEDSTPSSDLHWTGPLNNWNHNCAFCHSTDLQKNFDLPSRKFQTSWKQVNVGCQSCHGPASEHLKWVDTKSADISNKGFAIDMSKLSTAAISDTCGTCHSRRRQLTEKFRPGDKLLDHFDPALLRTDLYHSDGQIDAEVYVYGSFLQSRMFAAGVRCTDCHNPHTAELKVEGDELCTQCHNQAAPITRFPTLQAKDYDTVAHHFHATGAKAPQCVDCHMSSKTYMQIDPRRDHSFRKPDPALAAVTDSPLACLNCHADKNAGWAATAIRKNHPDSGQPDHYGYILHAGRSNSPGAAEKLVKLMQDQTKPDIVRATAVSLLAGQQNPQLVGQLVVGLNEKSDLVRLASLRALPQTPPENFTRFVVPMLGDPVRIIRIEAARLLAGLPHGNLDQAQINIVEAAEKDYVASEMLNADRAESHHNLGNYWQARGDLEQSENSYRTAIDIDPKFAPPYLNLAELFRQKGNQPAENNILDAALAALPKVAEVRLSYGLMETRQERPLRALESFRSAYDLAPTNGQIAYIYAISLENNGNRKEAIRVLRKYLQEDPWNTRALQAVMQYLILEQDYRAALDIAKKLQRAYPNNQQLRQLTARLNQQIKKQ